MKQLSGGMKRLVGFGAGTFELTGIFDCRRTDYRLIQKSVSYSRNLLVDFSENRTVLLSTHVVEDLAATCNQLAIMHKGSFFICGVYEEFS